MGEWILISKQLTNILWDVTFYIETGFPRIFTLYKKLLHINIL